jgi:membrane-bound acyltransferase YfiQ involved in biofilm formation
MLISIMGMLVAYNVVYRVYVSLENMPVPLQVIANISFKMVLHHCKINNDKRFGFFAIWKETLILFGT